MNKRFFTILSLTSFSKTKHYEGLLSDFTNGINTQKKLGPARFLTIEENEDGFFLYRFDDKGNCVGDTWHQSLNEAKEQADYEFEQTLKNWQDVPPDIQDASTFALHQIS
ncbi:MAG: hypothetical protein PW788_09605 [Micavibrio sp.]|nr:hypothetical protein [Micavibrio sp.]